MKATKEHVKEWYIKTGRAYIGLDQMKVAQIIDFHNWMEEKEEKLINTPYFKLNDKELEQAKIMNQGSINFCSAQIKFIESAQAERANKIKVGDRFETLTPGASGTTQMEKGDILKIKAIGEDNLACAHIDMKGLALVHIDWLKDGKYYIKLPKDETI